MAGLLRRKQKKDGFPALIFEELAAMPGLFIVVTDPHFALAWANDYFYEFFNCRADELAGRLMHDFLGEDIGGDMSPKHIARLLEAGHIWDHKARTHGADGEFVIIRWNQKLLAKEWILSLGVLLEDDRPRQCSENGVSPKPAAEWAPVTQAIAPTKKGNGDTVEAEKTNINNTEETPASDQQSWLTQDSSCEQLLLYYQPRVNARTKAIVGAEGLMRLMHHERGLLYPATFMPELERSGKIIEFGSHIIDAACKKLQEWNEKNPGLSVSINVSPKQFCDEDFLQILISAATRHRIEPSRLMLEMSEPAVASHLKEASQTLEMLQGAGFKTAIDEYSASFLPIASLAKLPINNIGIDRSSFAEASHNPKTSAVLESVIKLTRSLGMTVTASGVENRRQLDFLLDNSVDYLQGYLISEALPESDFEHLLKTNPDFYTRHI